MQLKLILFRLVKKRKKKSIIDSDMLIHITMLLWKYLGEVLLPQEVIGIAFASVPVEIKVNTVSSK
jgi:hypothetical protein